MAQFTYTDEIARVYLDVKDNATGGTLFAQPGASYDLDADPGDGRWTAATGAPKAPQTAPEAPVADAIPAPDQTPAN